jgi:hypothetical protein
MQTIWKYPLANPASGPTRIDLPVGSYLLRAAAIQGDQLVVWAVVDDAAPATWTVFVEAVPTGQRLAPAMHREHLATVTHPETGVVWHVFELLLGLQEGVVY